MTDWPSKNFRSSDYTHNNNNNAHTVMTTIDRCPYNRMTVGVALLLVLFVATVSVVESLMVVPKPITAVASFRSTNTQLGVLADAPSKGSDDEEMFWDDEEEGDGFSFDDDDDEEEEDFRSASLSSSSQSPVTAAAAGQPIRRLRRDKREPLIAVVGRPNVVRTLLLED